MSMVGQVIRATTFGDGIHCRELFYPSGFLIPPHAHEQPFFALTLQGSFSEEVQGELLEFPVHTTLYQAAGQDHSFRAAGGNVRCFVLELNRDDIEQRYSVRLSDWMPRKSQGALPHLMIAAYRELRHHDAMSSLAVEALVLQMLVESQRTGIDRGRPLWLRSVEDVLRQRFRSPLTLIEIAEEVGVPPVQVSAAFRRVYGRSIADEQRRLRIEFASRRLVDSEASLAEIGLEAGFADQPHFSRTFKRLTGMTPAEYRRATTTSSASR